MTVANGYLRDPATALVDYAAFRARWTDEELQALFAAEREHWQVRDYVNLATAQGHVNLSGETAAAAKAAFVALEILTSARADLIFGE